MNKPERWTLDGFLTHFDIVDKTMMDHAYAWVIGAGASKQPGIPTGGELVQWWLQELHQRECHDGRSFEDWAKSGDVGIEKFIFERAAESYPKVYERRFRAFPEEGYAYLEHVMTGMEKVWKDCRREEGQREIQPSPGYSILAKIMEDSRHKAVITTNFDNLVSDALHIYTDTYPLVCGHESLTGFVQAAMRRPIVCKIHRDLLLHPHNDRRGVSRLHDSWSATLRTLLARYTPIFVGYGGNDESLMGQLESLGPDDIKGRLIWCYYEGRDKKSEPNERIQELVAERNGVLVAIPDFDRFMILLGHKIGVQPLDHVLEERAKRRTAAYQKSVMEMQTNDFPQLIPALRAVYQRVGWEWWSYQLEVDLVPESDPIAKEAAYRRALAQLPDSPQLFANFAWFLHVVRKNYSEAERLYRLAMKLDSMNGIPFGNFAGFLIAQGRIDEATELLTKAESLNQTQKDEQLAAELLLYRCAIQHLQKEDSTNSIAALRQHLAQGFERGEWSFDFLWGSVEQNLDPLDAKRLIALGDAILDPAKVADLDALFSDEFSSAASHPPKTKSRRVPRTTKSPAAVANIDS